MKKQLLFAFGAAALLASCSNDIDSPKVNDGYLKVNATIGGVQTRMDGTQFENNDQIGVNVTSDPQNVSYTYTTAFAATGEGIKVSEEIQVSAYYPFSSDATSGSFDFTVVGDQNAPKSTKEADLLFAQAVTVTSESATANFQFAHVNSQISLTLVDKTSNEILKTANTSIALNNVAVNGTFNTINGVVTPKTANGTIAIASPSTTAANVVIVPSYATDNQNEITVVVKVDEVTYTGKIKPVLKAANRYNYNLNINDTDPGVTEAELNITGTIGSWTDNTGGGADQNGDVDVEPDYVLSVGDYLLKDGSTIAPSSYSNQDVVGVVFFVGNPQASVLHSDKITDVQDALKVAYPNAVNGLAIALDNADLEGTKELQFRDKNNDYAAWLDANAETDYGKNLFKGEINANVSAPQYKIGYNYTQVMVNAENQSSTSALETESNFVKVLKAYNEANKVNGNVASTWFLPSYQEFEILLSNYATVKVSLEKLQKSLSQFDAYTLTGSSTQSYTPNNKSFYWTSDVRAKANQWVHELNTAQSKPENAQDEFGFTMYLNPASSGSLGYFRFAIAF